MAAVTLVTTNFNNSSDANFRTWVAAIIAAIVAGGWVQTSDTGQINTSTVTAPVAINTVAGYAIFRSNDSGGAIHEYYIKIEFGSGGVSATRPSLWVTFGWASDGAGNLVSTSFPVSTRKQSAAGATPAGASISINMAAGAGYICIAATSSLNLEDVICSIERTRDTSLNLQDQVLCLLSVNGTLNNSVAGFSQVIDRLNAYPANDPIQQCFVMPANANTPVAGKAGLGLYFGFAPGNTSPSMNLFGVETSSIGNYQDGVSVPILNVNHSYKIQRDVTFGAQASTVLISRFE